jgi:PAS domain S-box-containing protein
MDFSSLSSWLRNPAIAKNLLAAVLALLASQVGFYLLTLPDGKAAVVWIASGIAIAWIAIFGLQVLPGLFLGYFIANLIYYNLSAVSLLLPVGVALTNTSEAALGGWILRRFSQPPWLSQLKDAFIFIGIVAIAPPLASATLGGIILCATEQAPWDLFGRIWQTWVVGNITGIFVTTPLFLTWSEGSPGNWVQSKYQIVELVWLLGGAIAFTNITFTQSLSLEYLLLPLLAWIAYRFNRQIVTLSIAILSALAIWEITTKNANQFVETSMLEAITSFQLFLSVITLTILSLSTVLYERQQAQIQLQQANQQLEKQVQDRTASLKNSEETLQKQETFLRKVIDTNPNVIFVKDNRGRFRLANQALANVYGTTIEDLIGKTDADFNPNRQQVEQFHQDDQQVIRSGETRILEESVTNGNRQLRHFQTIKTPLQLPETQETYVLGVAADITERKQVESELEHARQAAEAANRAKSRFLATMSHELRTPLNGILGYAQILRRCATISESDRQNVQIIEECGSHLLTLINDILELSQIELQKLKLHPSEFHLPSLLARIVHLYQFQANRKNITLTYEPDPQLPEAVYADEKRLRQVLTNLLDNAVKFTEVGNVTFQVSILETQPTNFAETATNQRLRFQIQDTGVGIDREQLEQIFQPFEQIGELNQKSAGTGLGLSLSQKIINLMDSEIQVISEPGVGSIFWFDVDFPLAQPSSQLGMSIQQRQVTGYQGYTRCLLVVDSQPENRAAIADCLQPLGFDIVEATDTTSGIRRAQELIPDLILTKATFPNSDRFYLVRQIRQSQYLAHLPIIVLLDTSQTSDRRQSIAAGGNDFLSHPIDPAELLQKLEKHLQLQWIYQEKSPTPQPSPASNEDPPTIPPTDAIETLYQLTRKGSLKKVQKYVASLQQRDPQLTSFSQKVLQLARSFQEEELLEFLEKHHPN